ncbi:hypothetical protein CHS0354_019236 [Potamilus streckersoni]|uniref:Thioredoxin domain-containing protein n=1 Tax=Potamilus streckersoni TaxID=2493646 RepID=A0AAE0W575_9BIVA|nr:hypothetical protein CHS0354_019236 [Potamilus streckersoni]
MACRIIVRRLLALTRSHSRRAYGSHLPRLTSTHFSQITQRIQSASLHYCQLRRLSAATDQFIINIQDPKDFQEKVIDSKIPVVVDFHATWCGPCKLLGPRLETIIAGKKGKVILAKVDIDENADIAMRYGVQAVPTVLAIKNGTSIDKFVGLQDDDQVQTFVEKLC